LPLPLLPQPPASLGRTWKIAAVVAFVLLAVTVEVFFARERADLLATIGLKGMGVFLWVFVALWIGLEVARNLLKVEVEDVERAAGLLLDGGEVPGRDLVWLHCLYEDFRSRSRVCALAAVSDPAALSGLLKERPGEGIRFVRMLLDRLEDRVSTYGSLGVDLAAQLGLLGTVTGLVRALDSLSVGLKDIKQAGGEALAALGGSQLGTAFSTTQAACYCIIAVLLLAGFLRLRVRGAVRQLEHRLSWGHRHSAEEDHDGCDAAASRRCARRGA